MKHDPTLFVPRSMFCDFDFGDIIGPIIGGIGSIIGGSQAAGAAADAAGAQVEAARLAAGVSREALGFQREMYNVGRADLSPYRATGAGALRVMNNMFLPGGDSRSGYAAGATTCRLGASLQCARGRWFRRPWW